MGTFKKIFFSKKTIALGLVLVILLAVGLYFLINTLSNNFSQDPDMGLVLGSDSTMAQMPIDGTRPSDHDPKDNAYYALYKLNQLKSFKSYSEGETITHVAFASVSQKIKASRVVNNGEVYKESLSHSSFKGVGVRNYIKGENYVTLNASSVKSIDDVTWDTTAKKISKTDYVNLYGYVPSGITSYIFSEDTILNAEYLGEENGVFSYRYELDTVKSVAKLALEMRTMAGTASLPIFERAFVTIKMDKDWKVLSTTTDCTYKVDMLGGVTCTEAVTEIFTNHGEDVEIPNGDFFRSYVDDEVESVTPSEKTASDYLMAGFGDYITGIKPLKVSLDIVSTDEKLPLSVDANAIINVNMNDLSNLSAFIELEELVYDDFTFEDINVAYKNNDIYLKWKDIKAKANIDATITKLQSLLPLFGVEMPSLDFGEIDTETLLSGATVTKDGTNVAVNLPLSLGDICLNATLNFTEDDAITFTGATAEIFGLNITLTPDESVTIDTTLSGYSDLLTVLDVIDENGKINLDVSISNTTIKTQISLKPFAIDIKLGDITAKLSDNVVYLNYKDIKAKLALDNETINGILTKLSPIIGVDNVNKVANLFGSFDNIDVNSLLNEVIGNIETTTTENSVVISTTVMDMPISILLNNANNEYTIGSISASIDNLNVVIEPTDTSFTAIDDTTNYCDISTLLNIIDENGAISLRVAIGNINALVKIDLTNFDIDVFVDDLTIDGILIGDITAKLSDNVVYLNYKDIKAKLALDSETINGILTKLSPIIGVDNVNKVANLFGSFDNIDVNSLLNEVIGNIETTTTENGVVISTTVFGYDVAIVLNNANNEYTINSIGASIDSLNVVIEPTDTSFTAIDDTTNYCDISTLLNIIDENGAISLRVEIGNINALVKIDLTTFDIDVFVDDLTIDGILIGDITAKLSDNTIYLNYKGIKAKLALDSETINGILTKLSPIIGVDNVNKVANLFGSFDNIDVNSLLNEVIGNIETTTTENGVVISTTVFGYDVAIVLNNANNEYTINSIGASIDSLNVVIEPTDTSFTAIDDTTNYCDISTLLNIIDENGAISLRVEIGNINALVKIDLTTFDIDVFVDDLTIDGILIGDITAKLSDNTIYLNYKGIKAKLALDSETINGILTKLSPIIGVDNVNKVANLFGSFDNIDVNSLLNEVIGNIETTTTENGVVISTTVFGYDVAILLNNAEGKYTVNSTTVIIDDTNSIVITPNDTILSGIAINDLGNYANLASLLDMIDENNDVYFKLLFSEAEIIATLSLDDLVLTATYDGLKLYVDLKTLDVYLNYGDEAVLAKANLNDVDEILQKIKPILNKFMDVSSFDGLNVSAITSINVQDILNSITVNEMDNKLTVSLSINGVNVNAVFGTTDGLRLDELNVTMGEKFNVSASIINKPDDYKIPEFDFNLEYSDAKALVEEFSGIIESILYTDSLNVKIGGSITSGDTVFTIVDGNITIAGLSSAPKANASIVLEQKNTVTGETFNHTVTLIYLDPSLVDEGAVNVYFTYDNSLDGDSKLEGTFTTTKAGDTWAILKEIYKQMPDLQTSLEGILTPDENGYPTLPKFEFSVEELIKSISYKDGLLSGTLDTSVIMSSLPKQLGAEITRTENSLDVNIPNFDFGGTNVQLGVNVSVPDTTDVTDDTFDFDATNASDFSSIHLLLETLANTSTNRSFHITGNIGADIGELTIAPDAIKLDVKLDVDDNGLTFAKVVIERTHVELLLGAIQAWEDYDGVSTLYYDAENGLIHVEIMSRTKKTEWVGWKLVTTYPETYTYYTYTVEEYTANLMDRIFELLPLKSTWVDLINKETSKEDTNTTSTATVENTLKKYAYGANKDGEMTFTLNLDLAPLTKDVGLTNVYITHDSESMSLKGLTADTTIANILRINLSAEMKNQSNDLQGVKEEIASVKSLFPAPTKSN